MQSEGRPKYPLPNWFRDLKRTAIKEHFRLKQNEKIRTLMLSKNYLVPTKRVYNKKVLSAYFLPVLGLSVGSSGFSLFSCFSFFFFKIALKNDISLRALCLKRIKTVMTTLWSMKEFYVYRIRTFIRMFLIFLCSPSQFLSYYFFSWKPCVLII